MIWLLCGLLWAQDGLSDPPLGEPPAIEDRAQIVYTIAKDLRCPTCQGVSVADSSADGAMAMKARIEELVSQGYTSDQVFDYFVEKQYIQQRGGPSVASPNLTHFGLFSTPPIAALRRPATQVRVCPERTP